MTTKISIIFLASWALLFAVENLGAILVTFPGAHGSPLIKKGEQQQPSFNSEVNPLNSDHPGQVGGHGLPGKAAALASHRVKTREASYDQDYDDSLNSQPYLGAIGCTFSKTLCDSKQEWCFNDYAFGRCLKIYEPPEPSKLYRYALTKEDSHSLEKEMERLHGLGYRWGHAYTQCILQNSLDAIRLGTSWDTSSCTDLVDSDLEGAMNAFQEDIDPMNLAFVKFTPSQNNPHADFADELYRPPSVPIQTSAVSSPVYEKLSSPSSASAKSSIQMKFLPEKNPLLIQNIKSQLKALPPRQEINSIPEGPEEELLEEAIAEYVARTGQRHKWNPLEKKAYPYYTSFRQPINFDEEIEEDTDGEVNNDVEEDRKMVREATKELQEEIEAEIILRTLEEAAEIAAAEEAAKSDRSLWQDVPQQPHVDLEGDTKVRQEESVVTQPRIFSTVYNTPHLFRLGIETKDPESAMFAAALEEAAEEEEEKAEDKQQGEFQELPLALPLVDNNDWEERAVQPEFAYVNQDDSRTESIDPPTTFDDKPLYTEGGLVYLNNNPKRRFILDFDDISNNNIGRRNSGFERHERLDVKKPGPWYRTVNNFAFDYEEKMRNPEFASNEGPADMLPSSDSGNEFQDSNVASVRTAKNVNPLPLLQDQLAVRNMLPQDAEEEVTAEKKSSFVSKFPPADTITNHVEVVDKSQVNVVVEENMNYSGANDFRNAVADALEIRPSALSALTFNGSRINFRVEPNEKNLNATDVAEQIASRTLSKKIAHDIGIHVVSANAGQPSEGPFIGILSADYPHRYLFMTFFVALFVISLIVGALTLYLIRRQAKQHEKIARMSDDTGNESCKDYQDLCRARMASKNNEKVEPIKAVQRVASTLSRGSDDGNTSSRSSTSSWSEEPVLTNMDISTGHMVLSYMEDHLKNKDRLDQEWGALCAYEADPCSTSIAEKPENMKKNRFTNSLPYDHSRVILSDLANVSGSDYINASTITDHDPRNPAYIATQGPLANTSADFWQMVWEQGSVVIVTLTRLADNGTPLCHRYWPEEGSELHHIYEVHLVSEHIWCDEYLVRSFYLKNLKTGETRTVTQFHFQAWPENSIPTSTKAILEFRRKVNKSYRGRSCPIIVHCSDGAGRTGTYCLIDMVLNRMAKGAKEIDIAASLEHIRDQRPGMVRTKQQFEFVLMAVAEEVHAILKALPQ